MLKLIKGDITTLNVEAIVNAANNKLLMGGGVCGAIFAKANGSDNSLSDYCNAITLTPKTNNDDSDDHVRCHTGNSVITPAFRLSSINPSIKYIIHAVGPIYKDGNHNEDHLLSMAYVTAMYEALVCNVRSIAFPFISSGIFGYPKDKCAQIAMNTLSNCAKKYDIEITMCAFSDDDFNALNKYLPLSQ